MSKMEAFFACYKAQKAFFWDSSCRDLVYQPFRILCRCFEIIAYGVLIQVVASEGQFDVCERLGSRSGTSPVSAKSEKTVIRAHSDDDIQGSLCVLVLQGMQR